MHVIAGKAVSFCWPPSEHVPADQRRTVENAAVLAATLAERGARSSPAGRTTT